MYKEIQKARKVKLQELINIQYNGRVAYFVRANKLTPSIASYISQLFSGKREFGEKSARNLEKKCGLENGWFDKDYNNPEKTRAAILNQKHTSLFKFDRERAAILTEKDINMISDFIDFLITRAENKQSGNN